MSRLRTLVAGLCAFGIAAAPTLAAADCYTAAEWPAFNVKVMTEMLQDAALQCTNVTGHNHDNDYNGLILRSQDRVRADGNVLRQHFKRVYGGAWENRMDKFASHIENVAQLHSMTSMTFCADSDVLFADVARATSDNLETVAIAFNQAHFDDLADIGTACPTHRATIRVAAKRGHHHKVKKIASSD